MDIEKKKTINTNNIDLSENLLNICIKSKNEVPKSIFNIHINNILIKAKDKISDNKEWDYAKKLSNNYELIHIPSKKKNNDSIAKYIPLSRSYFKMWEILKKFKLVDDFNYKIKISSIAEGPGGFIESIHNYRKTLDYIDDFNAITLNSNKNEIPGWNKAKNYLKENTNIKIHYGEDRTGNIYSVQNIMDFATKAGKHNSELVTADGGFDFSVDFNKQEQLAYRLIFSEIVTALCVQKKKGHFVLKIFDIYTKMTVDLLYILFTFYESFTIYKPVTSRPANSEKYVICKNFKGINSKDLGSLLRIVHNWQLYDNGNNLYIHELFNNRMPINYINYIKSSNEQNSNKQLESIIKTLKIIQKNNELDFNSISMLRIQIIKALKWCKRYDIEINIDSKYLSNFIL